MENMKQEKIHKIKKRGAIFAGIVVAILIIMQFAFYVWGFTQEMPPIGIVVFCIVIPIVLLVGIIYVTKERIKEIEGGEEDEASKY